MAIYDAGTASLAADGTVTGVGTTWRQPLTLIRVGATMIFNTSPISIVTIAEILSDTSIRAFNDKGFIAPAGTQYFILAHDGITVQGLAQDVAETLRYYQSQETSIASLVQLAQSGDFDFDRLQSLINEAKSSETNAASSASAALASQQAAATSRTQAASSASSAQAAYNNTVDVIANAGDAGTLVTLAEDGIASTSSATISSLDWQQFEFKSGGNYRVLVSNMTNTPGSLAATYTSGGTTLFLSVSGTIVNSSAGSYEIDIYPAVLGGESYRSTHLRVNGAKGSRTFYLREYIMVEGGKSVGGATASRARGLLDVYSKAESDAVRSIALGGTGATTAAAARTNLDVYSKSESSSLFVGDLVSYGADNTGLTPCDSAFQSMISDGRFVVNSGDYLITSTKVVDIGLLSKVEIAENVRFIVRSNIDAFVFKNPIANFDANGMRIEVDIDGGGYSGVALTLRGSPYYTGPQNFSRLSQRTYFGNFYVFNKQGAIKQESATSPVNDEGYGFSIDCNSSDQEIMVWNDIDVSSTGFTNAHAIGVGTNSLNFISSLDLNLVAWFSTNHFVDNSVPQSSGNVSGGIGDISIRLKSQPHAQMQKVVKIANGIGFMDGCRFDLTIWDPNLINYRAGIVDATSGNHYTNTMERLSYPITRAINLVDASIFPVRNFSSTIQDSNIVVSSSSEIAKYLYLSGVTPSMSLIDAFNAINDWCVANGVKSDFEFKLSLHEATGGIRSVFQPFLNAIQDDTGFLSLSGHYYSGQMSVIRVVYQVNPITSGGKIEEHEIVWNRNSNLVSHRLKEYTYGSTAEIRAKAAIQPVGFTTYDTTFNIPVWYNGTSWLKSDGSVAYTA